MTLYLIRKKYPARGPNSRTYYCKSKFSGKTVWPGELGIANPVVFRSEPEARKVIKELSKQYDRAVFSLKLESRRWWE